ncbi:MAG: homoserine kinase [Nitriliruptoraceae bacterium]
MAVTDQPAGPASALRHHTVQVPATSANLGAGFDAFGIALAQHLVVRSVDRDQQSERVRALDGTSVPSGDDNLVWRSFVAFCEHHDVTVPDVAIVARTEIPLERGLGSSSAAIVAGLTLARELTGVVVGDPAVVELATDIEGHPDNVAPAVLGGLVACARGDDGQLVIRRVNPTPALAPVLFVPELRQSTASARAVLPTSLPRAEVAEQAARAGHVLAALTGAWPPAPSLSGDRLHEPARAGVMPAPAQLLSILRQRGVHAWLSGAGPSVAAVVRQGESTASVTALAAELGFATDALVWDLSGARSCPDGACGLSGLSDCPLCPRQRL